MMTLILMLIGLFFLVGWAVAIIYAIRFDLREYRERKNEQIQSQA